MNLTARNGRHQIRAISKGCTASQASPLSTRVSSASTAPAVPLMLHHYIFTTLAEVRRMTGDWQRRYNARPSASLSRRSVAHLLCHGIINHIYV